MRNRTRSLLLFFLWSVALTPGCRRDTLETCRKHHSERRLDQAALVCGRVFDKTGDPRAGANALSAHLTLDHRAEVRSLYQRLQGTSVASKAMLSLAGLERRENNLDRARALYREAAERLVREGRPRDAVIATDAVFDLAFEGSRFGEALSAIRLQEQQARKLGTPESIRDTLRSLARLLRRVGDLPGARRALDDAVPLLGPEDRDETADIHLRRGLVAEVEGDLVSGRSAYRSVLAVEGAKPEFALAAHINLVELETKANDHAAAADRLARAQALHRALPPSDASKFRVDLLWAEMFLAQAQKRWAAADAILGRMAALDPPADKRWKIALRRAIGLEALGRADEAEPLYLEAVRLAEAVRAEVHVADVKAWMLAGNRKPHGALFEHYFRRGRFNEALAVAERAQARTFVEALFSARFPGATAADAVAGADLLRQHSGSLRGSSVLAPRPIEELLDKTRESHVLLFFEEGDNIYGIAAHDGKVRVRKLREPTSTVRRSAARLHSAPDDPAAGALLGGLIDPELLPPTGARLYIAPSDAVARVPFPVVRAPGGRLVERYDLVQVPSLTALAALKERGRGGEEGSPVVLADARGDLAGAAQEARVVAEALGTAPLLGAAATEKAIRRSPPPSLLHLSLHSGSGAGGAWIEFADRRVPASEVLAWTAAPQVVVLASCASGITRHPDSWGSLASAFLIAGATTVVGSLWSIDDRATRKFMADFYQNGAATDPARALALTQRSWVREGKTAQMAAFVVYGLGRPVPADKTNPQVVRKENDR